MSESENKLHAVNYGSDGEKINAIKTSTDSNNGETVTSGIVTNHHTNNTSDFQRRRNKRYILGKLNKSKLKCFSF